MSKLSLAVAVPLLVSLAACAHTAADHAVVAPAEVLLASEVDWQQLNPARGDKSPKAGTLWGDRNGTTATGFLVAFVDGFSSPPHIHNVTYRGVVISGLVHNDDPDAAHMWMPPGSFWTRPKGEVHITAAKGETNVAYIEIESGPYLVRPTDQAFDSGERPVNVDASNVVWVDPSDASASSAGLKMAYLWGSPEAGERNGTFVRVPAGSSASLRCEGATFRAVVISGRATLPVPGEPAHVLDPGGSFRSATGSAHVVTSGGAEDCVLYVRADSRLDVGSASGR